MSFGEVVIMILAASFLGGAAITAGIMIVGLRRERRGGV